MPLSIQTQPAAEPVALDDVKRHLRIDTGYTDDDTWLTDHIAAARRAIEGRYMLTFIDTVWRWTMPYWPAGRVFHMPRGQLRSVTSIQYIPDGVTDRTYTPVAAGDYTVFTTGRPGRVKFVEAYSLPSLQVDDLEPVELIYTVGFGAAGSDVKAQAPDLLTALYVLIEAWYTRGLAEWPEHLDYLCGPYSFADETDKNLAS